MNQLGPGKPVAAIKFNFDPSWLLAFSYLGPMGPKKNTSIAIIAINGHVRTLYVGIWSVRFRFDPRRKRCQNLFIKGDELAKKFVLAGRSLHKVRVGSLSP